MLCALLGAIPVCRPCVHGGAALPRLSHLPATRATCTGLLQGLGQAPRYEGSWAAGLNAAGISVCGLDNQGCGRSEGLRVRRWACCALGVLRAGHAAPACSGPPACAAPGSGSCPRRSECSSWPLALSQSLAQQAAPSTLYPLHRPAASLFPTCMRTQGLRFYVDNFDDYVDDVIQLAR